MAAGPYVLVPALATTVSLVFTNQTLIGLNAAIFARLYYSTSPTGSSPVQIGVDTPTFGGSDMPKRWNFSLSGVPYGVYVAGWLGSNTSGNTNAADVTYFSDLPGAYDPDLVLSGDAVCCHDPMLDDILAAVTHLFPSTT